MRPGEWKPIQDHYRDIYRENNGGMKEFYRGLTATIIRSTIIGAVYMGSYDATKQFFIRNGILNDGVGC
jgi:hypothetical protein